MGWIVVRVVGQEQRREREVQDWRTCEVQDGMGGGDSVAGSVGRSALAFSKLAIVTVGSGRSSDERRAKRAIKGMDDGVERMGLRWCWVMILISLDVGVLISPA